MRDREKYRKIEIQKYGNRDIEGDVDVTDARIP